jgi:hypothetical protein
MFAAGHNALVAKLGAAGAARRTIVKLAILILVAFNAAAYQYSLLG